jgi:hypothetical protein
MVLRVRALTPQANLNTRGWCVRVSHTYFHIFSSHIFHTSLTLCCPIWQLYIDFSPVRALHPQAALVVTHLVTHCLTHINTLVTHWLPHQTCRKESEYKISTRDIFHHVKICGVLYSGVSAVFVTVQMHVMFKYANQFGQIWSYEFLLSCLGAESRATHLYDFRFRLKGVLGRCTRKNK